MNNMQKLREELQALVQKHGIQDSRVIRKSQQLDKLIVQYMKRTRRTAINWPAINNLLDNEMGIQSPAHLPIKELR